MGNRHESLKTHIFSMFFILHLLAFSSHYTTSAQQAGDGLTISLSDFQALLAFKREADPMGVSLRSWNMTRNGVCSGNWTGVKCVKEQVIALHLPSKGLTGVITPQIGLLKSLRKISLHDNFITGTIPDSIGLLTNLRGLHLFKNRLSGLLPLSIGRSRSLRNIDLSRNFLNGSIPSILGNSTRIYRLNLSFNSLSGSIPDGVCHSPSLSFLSLDHNNLSGTIPNSLTSLNSLKVLTLSHNLLSGQIPQSMGNLGSLTQLDLSQNNFTGEIPASISQISSLTSFNVSHNSLSGEVPSGLTNKFNSSSFVGNLQLCGYTRSSPCLSKNSPSPSPAETKNQQKESKLSARDKILILAGASLALLLLLCCVLHCCLVRKISRSKETKDGAILQKDVDTPGTGGSGDGKLVLFNGPLVFTVDNLLCATAEVMGRNAYSTVYKANMEDGNRVAVKRLREKLTKSPKEFEVEAAALGRIRHPNLLPLIAYYIDFKSEKLLVSDCTFKGSLSSFLHGHGPETTIDWRTRMKISLGITRGLHHLHVEQNMAHGNLTASEVYLDEQNEPKISDYGISRLMTDSANTNVIANNGSTGYRAPELQKIKKATTKSDIYSLGVIMLELLTGKPPGEQIEGADLPQWVKSIVKEGWTNEVFDLELIRDAAATGDEMLNMLKLALLLVDPLPESRPEIHEVIQQLKEINPMLADVALDRLIRYSVSAYLTKSA